MYWGVNFILPAMSLSSQGNAAGSIFSRGAPVQKTELGKLCNINTLFFCSLDWLDKVLKNILCCF